MIPGKTSTWDAAVQGALVVAPDVQHAHALYAHAALPRHAQHARQRIS